MKLRVTPSSNGRTVGNAGNIKTAEGHLGTVTEQHYNIQSSPSAAFGDYSGDMAMANATAQGFSAAASAVDSVASMVKTYEDGRDQEEISKMHSDMGLFHETKMRELAGDGEASANEKMDSYNASMDEYQSNMLNGSKLTSRGVKKAKSKFDGMTREMKVKYSTGQYQKDHISDYKGIQDAKFQNIQDIAVSVGQDGDPNGFMKVMNMVETLELDLSNPTFMVMHGDKAEERVRVKQMDVVEKYFKSTPPETYEQLMANPDVESGLIAAFGESDYADFKDDITLLMAKKADKEERAANNVSAERYQQYNKQLIAGEHISADDVYRDDSLNLQDQNRISKQIKVANEKFQKKIRLKTQEEVAVDTGRLYAMSKKNREAIYENNFQDFIDATPEQQLVMMRDYKIAAREYPKLYLEHLNTTVMSSDPELAANSLQVLQTMSAADRTVKLPDATQTMMSVTSVSPCVRIVFA